MEHTLHEIVSFCKNIEKAHLTKRTPKSTPSSAISGDCHADLRLMGDGKKYPG